MLPPPPIPDFELLKRIGGGSYGDVWLGRSITGLYRAVKIVDRNRFKDNRPFLREFEGIKRFQQQMGQRPRQLALLHVGRDDEAGLLYYVMELADDVTAGTEIVPDQYEPFTLKALRGRPVSPSANECIRIGVELAEALAELHEAGLIHRDVKPSNIIFVNGVTKLADLGLIASSEHTLTSLGTPGYSPPEGSGTVRADLFSLGRILYELAAGLPPEEFPRLPTSALGRPDAAALLELNEVFLKAADPHPGNRYASAQAMVDDLRLIQAGRSLQELNRTKRLLGLALRIGAVVGLLAVAGLVFLGVRSQLAVRQLAVLEANQRRTAEENERFARYTSDLNLAQLSLARNNYGNARTALRRHIPQAGEPDLRNFEWHALWNESAGDPATIYGSPGGATVSALVVDPKHAQFATQEGAYPCETVVWDMSTGMRRSIAKNTYGIGDFLDGGGSLVVGTAKQNVNTLTLRDGQLSAAQPVTGILQLGLGDGRTVLLSEEDAQGYHFHLWDTVQQTKIVSWLPLQPGGAIPFSSAAVSPDHSMIAVAFFWGDGVSTKHELQVAKFATGEILQRLSTEGSVYSLAFSPDNQRLAIGMMGHPTRIVSLKNGQDVCRLVGHEGLVAWLEYSADGHRLASGGWDQTVCLWNAQSGALERVLRGHEGAVQVVRWLDADHLISASADGTCRRWALDRTGRHSTKDGLWTNSLGDVVFSPDGSEVAVTLANGSIGVLNSTTLELVRGFASAFQPLAYAKDGKSFFALSFSGRLLRCDFATGLTMELDLAVKLGSRLMVVETSALGDKVVIGNQAGGFMVWDLTTRSSILETAPGSKSVMVAAWTPEGGGFAIGYEDGLLELRTTAGGVTVLPRQTSGIRSLTFSHSGHLLAVGKTDGHVVMLDMKTRQPVAEFIAHNSNVTCALFTPGDERLITGGYDGFTHVWTLPSFRSVVAFPFDDGEHPKGQASLFRLKMSQDGQQLAGYSEEGRLRIWRAAR